MVDDVYRRTQWTNINIQDQRNITQLTNIEKLSNATNKDQFKQ